MTNPVVEVQDHIVLQDENGEIRILYPPKTDFEEDEGKSR